MGVFDSTKVSHRGDVSGSSDASARLLLACNCQGGTAELDKLLTAASKRGLTVESSDCIELLPFDAVISDIDDSGSMAENSKLEQVKQGLSKIISRRDAAMPFEVRAFGDRPGSCTASTVLASLSDHLSNSQLKKSFASLSPTGDTPLAYSIDRCLEDAVRAKVDTPLLLIGTDGEDTCEGNVCLAVKRFLTMFPHGQIIVLAIDPQVEKAFDCQALGELAKRLHFIESHDIVQDLDVVGKLMNKVVADKKSSEVQAEHASAETGTYSNKETSSRSKVKTEVKAKLIPDQDAEKK